MGTHVRFAEWHKEDGRYVVKPPGWPKNAELSFTDKADMIRWSHSANVMLKDGNNGRSYA